MNARTFHQASSVVDSALHLALAPALTPTGVNTAPVFFDGELRNPRIFVACLRLLGALPQRSYSMLRARTFADPILSAHGDCLTMEAFSACNSVYAQVVVDGEAFVGGTLGVGTTNVDISPATDASLQAVAHHDTLGLQLGDTGMRLTTKTQTATERPVSLPKRWIAGLAHSSAAARGLELRFSVDGNAARQFLANTPSKHCYLSATAKGLQRTQYAAPNSVYVHNVQRVELLRNLAPYIERLDVYATGKGKNSKAHSNCAFVAHLPHTTVTLLLTPSAMRGFSGEGALLYDLAAQQLLDTASKDLHFQSDISDSTNLDTTQLEALGVLGWSVVRQRFFHRQLPVDAYEIYRHNPRLQNAAKLEVSWLDQQQLAAHIATESQQNTTPGSANKTDGTLAPLAAKVGKYRVELHPDYCACRWFAQHGTSRGPCKHLIAAHQAFAAAQQNTLE